MEMKENSRFKKGHSPWNKGMKGYNIGPRSEEWKKNLREGVKKYHDIRGRKKSSQNRQDRDSIEYACWRESVFSRDNYTCQICNEKGGELHPHHIKPFAEFKELRFCVDNGQTLCARCHGAVHGINFEGMGRHLSCEICGVRFRPKSGHLEQKTCSNKCKYKLISQKKSPFKGKARPEQYTKPDRTCEGCGTSFRAKGEITGKFGSKKRRVQKYCSHACYLKKRWGCSQARTLCAKTGLSGVS